MYQPNYDFISKNKTLGKSIYNRVNETLSSIITKNNKYRYFSEFSKNVISLNKKIRTKNEINNLNKLIDLSKKIKQRNMLERSYVSRVDRSFADNFYYYSDKTDSKKIVKSVTLFNDLISKTKTSFSKSKEFLKNDILKHKKIKTKNEIVNLNRILDLNKRIIQRNMLERSYISKEDRSFIDNLYYYSDKTNSEKIVKSVTLFNDLISKTKNSFFKSKEFFKKNIFKNRKISKDEIENKINIITKNRKLKKTNELLENIYFDKNDRYFFDKSNHYFETSNFNKVIKSISSFSDFILNRKSNFIKSENLVNFRKNKIYSSETNFIPFHKNFIFEKKSNNLVLSKLTDNILKLSNTYFNKKKVFNYKESSLNKKDFLILKNTNKRILNKLSDSNLNFLDNNQKRNDKVYFDREIIYKKKTDIEKIISDTVQKIYKEKIDKEKIKDKSKVIYNEKIINKIKEPEKVEEKKVNKESMKQEVEKIVKSYMESINFRKISKEAVQNVETKVKLERYRNGAS